MPIPPRSPRLLGFAALVLLVAAPATAERRLETTLEPGGQLTGSGYRLELVVGQAISYARQ